MSLADKFRPLKKEEEGEEEEKDNPFSPWWIRGRVQIALRLQFKNGNIRQFRYMHCEGIDYTGGRIVIYFVHATVVIRGRHLIALENMLAEDKVCVIREQHQHPMEAEESMPYIDKIEILPPSVERLGMMIGGGE